MFKTKNILTICFLTLLLGLGAFSVSLWQTPKYKSTVKLLTVFNQTNIDTYTASKTANYITGILGEVIFSDSFIDSVYRSDPNLIDQLGNGSETRQKNWNKIVKVKVLENKGIIIIDSYGDNKYQTNLLASAISYTIINQHGIYDGSQDRAAIKMIDIPSIYENWSTTKIVRDTAIGFLAGLLLSLTFIIIFPNHKLFEFSPKKKYQKTMEPAKSQIEKDNRQSAIQNQPAASPANPSSYAKSDNPWLEKYYQENQPEKLN